MKKMTLSEIIESYRSEYKKQNVAEEIRVAIQDITVDEYEEFYLNLYKNYLSPAIYQMIPNSDLENLEGINNFVFNREISILLKNDDCIFDEFKQGGDDYNFFLDLNTSSFIKSMLDEVAEHGVRGEGDSKGHLLSSILGSICQAKHYEDIDALEMYATTWWKINTTHPFHNGNKRTSFIGVKSKMFSDIFFNWVDRCVLININDLEKIFSSDEFKTKLLPKMIKKINYWKKPTIDEALIICESFKGNMEEEIWESILLNEEISTIINNVVNEISKSVSKIISSDYILSIFIAKVTAIEYKNNDDTMKKRVIEVLKADLIISALRNRDYINNKFESLNKQLLPIIGKLGPSSLQKNLSNAITKKR